MWSGGGVVAVGEGVGGGVMLFPQPLKKIKINFWHEIQMTREGDIWKIQVKKNQKLLLKKCRWISVSSLNMIVTFICWHKILLSFAF